MNNRNLYFLLFLFIMISVCIQAQNKKTIIQKGITVVRTQEMHLDDGDDEFWVDEEEFFDSKGNLVEYKEYSDKGDDLKEWIKFKYDKDSQLIEKTELNEDGEQKKRIVYMYSDGLNTERWYYDDRNRLYQKKKYTYEFR